MKLDLLAFAAHPDDAELGCGGVLIAQSEAGRAAGVADLTRGELGTRGSPEIRAREAVAAAKILGLRERVNLDLGDGFFRADPGAVLEVIGAIRRFRPEIVLAPARTDRHPDHGRAAALVAEACFLAGLRRIDTPGAGAWRPGAVWHYIQDRYVEPAFAVDVTERMERKMEAVRAYGSQFHDPDSDEPETYITRPEFLENLYARAAEIGRPCGFRYAEGFTVERTPGVKDLFDLV